MGKDPEPVVGWDNDDLDDAAVTVLLGPVSIYNRCDFIKAMAMHPSSRKR